MSLSYQSLYRNTVVTARFTGGLQPTVVSDIMQSGYFKDPYYESSVIADLNSSRSFFIITSDIARYTGEEASVAYADGYSISDYDMNAFAIVVGQTAMDRFGLTPGDSVSVSPEKSMERLQGKYVNYHRTTYPDDTVSDESILELYHDAIAAEFEDVSRQYTIIGVVSSPSGKYDLSVFAPMLTQRSAGDRIVFDTVIFILADNNRVDEALAFAAKVDSIQHTKCIIDTSKLLYLKNAMKLIDTVYPITIVTSLVIGVFICCLFIMQSSKETAIMRSLGTRRLKVCVSLVIEQCALCLFGLVIGAIVFLVYSGAAQTETMLRVSVYAGAYFLMTLATAVVCSYSATRRSILRLLHDK
ncbi:MAG: hypothetical protein FWH33_11515 [Oscillospiraceae bacterium]|nr:hypothetical protein [Oscillospiraceae bacterium]